MYRLIVYAVPVFVLLMAAEYAAGRRRRRDTYRLEDSINSLGLGLLRQVVAACTQLFQVGLYAMVYPFIALWPRPAFSSSAIGWISGCGRRRAIGFGADGCGMKATWVPSASNRPSTSPWRGR